MWLGHDKCFFLLSLCTPGIICIAAPLPLLCLLESAQGTRASSVPLWTVMGGIATMLARVSNSENGVEV